MPVGPSPLNPDFSSWYKKKRHSQGKKEMKALQAGYETRPVKSYLTGDVYLLPKHDYTQLVKYLGEHHSELSEQYKQDDKQLYKNIQTPADYIDFAFEKASQKKNLTTVTCQGGHIKALTYNPLYKLLMVSFSNRGDVVVFFDLPTNIASQLIYFAENNTMSPPDKHGRERHAVGVYFWDVVRVRGSLHDTRYAFQYTSDFRTGAAMGRPQGVGPDGEPSKYTYMSNLPDARYKDPDKAPIIKYPQRARRYGRDDIQSLNDKGFEAHKRANISEDDAEDIINDYFMNGGYDTDIGKYARNKEILNKLGKLYEHFDNEDMPNADIYDELLKIDDNNELMLS